MLGRLEGLGALDIECGVRYRREHPESTREQYAAYIATEAGEAWETACLADQLKGENVDPRKADGILASFEVAFVLPQLLDAVRQDRAQQGLPDLPEPTAAMAARLPAIASGTFDLAGCYFRVMLEKVPLDRAISDPASLQPAFEAALQSGRCSPEPAGA